MLSLELQRVRAMASTSGPFKFGVLAELLINDYAKIGFSRGTCVESAGDHPGRPHGGESIKVAGGLRFGRPPGKGRPVGPAGTQTPCAVPDPPRAQPQVSTSPEVQLNTPAAQEPLLDFLRDPSPLICIRPRGRDAGDSSPEPDEHYPSNRKRQGGPPLPGDMLALELLRAYSPALASFTCQVMHHSLVL